MTLLVKSPVWDDLREIGLRIAQDNPDAADGFLTAAEGSFELLKRHSHIGRLRSFSVTGVRSLVIPEFQNYLIFYLPTGTEVQILAVLRGARDLASALARRFE
jgi:plasmid stabilization system protein ParE